MRGLAPDVRLSYPVPIFPQRVKAIVLVSFLYGLNNRLPGREHDLARRQSRGVQLEWWSFTLFDPMEPI
jgi:hypothetical protein